MVAAVVVGGNVVVGGDVVVVGAGNAWAIFSFTVLPGSTSTPPLGV